MHTKDVTRSTNLMQSYSRTPRDPSDGPRQQGLKVNISRCARFPDVRIDCMSKCQVLLISNVRKIIRIAIKSRSDIAGGVLCTEPTSQMPPRNQGSRVSNTRLISDRAHPCPMRLVIGQVANEWMPKDRSGRPRLPFDFDVVETGRQAEIGRPVFVRR